MYLWCFIYFLYLCAVQRICHLTDNVNIPHYPPSKCVVNQWKCYRQTFCQLKQGTGLQKTDSLDTTQSNASLSYSLCCVSIALLSAVCACLYWARFANWKCILSPLTWNLSLHVRYLQLHTHYTKSITTCQCHAHCYASVSAAYALIKPQHNSYFKAWHDASSKSIKGTENIAPLWHQKWELLEKMKQMECVENQRSCISYSLLKHIPFWMQPLCVSWTLLLIFEASHVLYSRKIWAHIKLKHRPAWDVEQLLKERGQLLGFM